MKNKTYDFINNFKIHVCGAVKTVSHYISKYMAKSEKQIFAVCGRTTDIINKKLKDRRNSKKRFEFFKKLKITVELLTNIALLIASLIAFCSSIKTYRERK